MAKKLQSQPIDTRALPQRCPACWFGALTRTSESGAVTRLTCADCAWSERYLVVERVPDHEPPLKGGQSLAFKKRHRVGPHR